MIRVVVLGVRFFTDDAFLAYSCWGKIVGISPCLFAS